MMIRLPVTVFHCDQVGGTLPPCRDYTAPHQDVMTGGEIELRCWVFLWLVRLGSVLVFTWYWNTVKRWAATFGFKNLSEPEAVVNLLPVLNSVKKVMFPYTHLSVRIQTCEVYKGKKYELCFTVHDGGYPVVPVSPSYLEYQRPPPQTHAARVVIGWGHPHVDHCCRSTNHVLYIPHAYRHNRLVDVSHLS